MSVQEPVWIPEIHGERRSGAERRRSDASYYWGHGSLADDDRRLGLGRRFNDWRRPANSATAPTRVVASDSASIRRVA